MARRGILDAPGAAAASLLLCMLLGQSTLYARDAHVLLFRASQGELLHDQHFTYGPLLGLCLAVMRPLGLSLYESARLYSACGVAVGVGLAHLASRRLGLGRADALRTTGLVALCPAVVFFGTVVEVHGPFFAFAGLAFLATAQLVAAPGWRSALLLGAAMGLASSAHSSANLLPLVLPPLAFGTLRTRRPDLPAARLLAWCAAAVAVQAALVALTPHVLRALDAPVSYAGARKHVGDALVELAARPSWVAALPRLFAVEIVKEWIWPMLPLSLAFLLGFRVPALRLRTGLLLAALLPYGGLAVLLLARFPDNSEHGAYLLPLVWPAALLTAAAWPRAALLPLLALSGALAVAQVEIHDDPTRSAAFAAGLRTVSGSAPPYLIAGDYRDLEALFVRMPDVPFLFLLDWVALMGAPGFCDRLDALLQQQHAAGRRVFLTEGTVAWLESPAVRSRAPAAPTILAHLRQQHRLEPVAAQGFRGWKIH